MAGYSQQRPISDRLNVRKAEVVRLAGMCTSFYVTIGLLMLCVSPAAAQPAFLSREGIWKLDIEQSRHETGDPLPKSSWVNVVKDDGRLLQFSQKWTSDVGKEKSIYFEGEYGGKQYKASDGEVIGFSHLSPGSFEDSGRYADSLSWVETCVFSDNGSKLTCAGTDTDKARNSFVYTEIWKKDGSGN